MSATVAVKKSGSPESLKELGRVGLDVERLPEALREQGLSDEEVKQIARDRLAGKVQLLSPTGALHLTGTPTLVLELAAAEGEQGPFAYTVSLEMVQGVSVKRIHDEDARSVKAPTWRAHAVLPAPAGDLAGMREAIGALADAFTQDLGSD